MNKPKGSITGTKGLYLSATQTVVIPTDFNLYKKVNPLALDVYWVKGKGWRVLNKKDWSGSRSPYVPVQQFAEA